VELNQPKAPNAVGNSAYEHVASTAAKADIGISTAVMLFIGFFRDWGFGLWWLAIIPMIWFAVSILIAMPFTLAKLAIGMLRGRSKIFPVLLVNLFEIAHIAATVFLTYYGLKWLSATTMGLR
jgi:hypothetical protein